MRCLQTRLTSQCDGVQFTFGCSGTINDREFSPRPKINPLTQDLRRKMNKLTENLNSQIIDAVGRARPGNGGSIRWVDPNPNFEEHGFCEEGNTEPSYRNADIWFFPYEYSTGGTLSYIRSFDNSTNCKDILDNPNHVNQGSYYACEIAEGIHDSPNVTSKPIPSFLTKENGSGAADNGGSGALSSNDLPDFLTRIFHSTIRGMTAYKTVRRHSLSIINCRFLKQCCFLLPLVLDKLATLQAKSIAGFQRLACWLKHRMRCANEQSIGYHWYV